MLLNIKHKKTISLFLILYFLYILVEISYPNLCKYSTIFYSNLFWQAGKGLSLDSQAHILIFQIWIEFVSIINPTHQKLMIIYFLLWLNYYVVNNFRFIVDIQHGDSLQLYYEEW